MRSGMLRAAVMSVWLAWWAGAPAAIAWDQSAPNGGAVPKRQPIPDDHLQWTFRERSQAVLADRIEGAIAGGHHEDAVVLLRRLLSLDYDSWVNAPDGGDVVSVRARASRAFWESAASRADLVGIWEREISANVREDGPDRDLWRVVGEGWGTGGARRAARILAGRLVDSGELGLAAALLSGDRGAEAGRASLLELMGEPPGGAVRRDPGAGSGLFAPDPEVYEWSVPLGDRRGASSAGRGVAVLRPEWSRSTVVQGSAENRVLAQWRQVCEESGFPAVMPIAPVIVRDTLVFRTASQVVAVGLFDGHERWRFATDRSVRSGLDDVAEGAAAPEVTSTLREWFGANEKLRALSSDGQRVFLIDGPVGATRSINDRPFGLRAAAPAGSPAANRLVALHLAAAEPGTSQVAWELVASDRGREEGCHFLGYPVPAGDWLLCLAELQREIVFLLIDRETGEIVWRQPLVAVPNRLTDDSERARLWRNYSPVVSGGVAICPTGTGLAVAVDFARRQLKWLQSVGRAPQSPQPFRRGGAAENAQMSAPWGFLSRWQIAGETVFVTAPEDAFLTAIDLESGAVRWRAPLGEREFFAGILADSAVILGAGELRRHSLADGGQLGKALLPAPPAGQPLLLADRLLVPLLSGQTVSVDPATCELLGDAWLQSAGGCEHLYPAGDLIVAVRPDFVAAYPTVSRARQELELARASGRVADASLLEAELAVLNRDLGAAEELLKRAIAASTSAGMRQPIERRLREVLLVEMRQGDAIDEPRLRLLRRLSATPAEIAEVCYREALWLRGQGRWSDLLELLGEMETLPGETTIAIAEDPERQFTIDGFGVELARVLSESPVRKAFAAYLSGEFERAGRERDVKALLRTAELARPVGELDLQRLKAASGLESLGLRGAAEQLLLSLKESDDPRVAVGARQDLCRIWAEGGWLAWAAQEYVDLERSRRLDPAWSRAWTSDGAGAVVRKLAEADWPVELHGSIELHPRYRPLAAPALSRRNQPSRENILRQFDNWVLQESVMRRFRFGAGLSPLRLPPEWPVGLVIHQAQFGAPGLGFVERLDAGLGTDVEQRFPLAVTARVTTGSDAEVGASGSLIPLAVPGGVLAISPLDGDEASAWDQRPAVLQLRSTPPRCGLLSPERTILQSHNVLFAVNTVDGRLQWLRRDLPPRAGMDQHQVIGVFGSRDSIAVMASNRKDFLVYRQHDGTLTGTVTLPRLSFNKDALVGDSLFFLGEPLQPGSRVYPLMRWSPGEERSELLGELDELHQRIPIRAVDDNHVCYVATGPTLKVYAVAERREIVSAALSPAQVQQIRDLKVWRDGERVYVNIQRDMRRVETRDFHEIPRLGTFGGPDLQTIRDELLAVDIASQQVLWSRRLPTRGMLPLTGWRAPFWLMLSQVRHREDQTLVTLRLELLDLRSGDIVASRDALPSHPTQEGLLGVFVDPYRREISLLGNKRMFKIAISPGPLSPGPSQQVGARRLDRR